MQLEFVLNDWRAMVSAPTDCTWVEVDTGKDVVLAHFAQDLSGEEQPPFIGWFVSAGEKPWHYFSEIKPKRWRPISC